MGSQKCDILSCLLVVSLWVTVGCGKKGNEGAAPGPKGASTQAAGSAQAANVDTEKPISEVQAQAETMTVDSLRATALKYKDAILAKQDEINKVAAKIKEIPIAQTLGEEAKTLKADLQNLETALKALKDRFQVYYDTLKKKGGDLSGLAL